MTQGSKWSLTGALIGGAVGAVGGAVTRPDTIDLGRPAWR
jgi:gas vesicle protein